MAINQVLITLGETVNRWSIYCKPKMTSVESKNQGNRRDTDVMIAPGSDSLTVARKVSAPDAMGLGLPRESQAMVLAC